MAKNELVEKSIYELVPKKSDFEKTEQDIIQSIIDDVPYVLKKTDDNYFLPHPENPIKIEDDFKKDNQDFIKTVTELNKTDAAGAVDAKNKKMNGIIDAAADFPLPNAIADDTPNVTDIFRDLFENKTMTKDDEKFLNDLISKIADAKNPQIIPYVKYIPVKTEEPKPKFDDVVIKKDPEIDESLPDLDAYMPGSKNN